MAEGLGPAVYEERDGVPGGASLAETPGLPEDDTYDVEAGKRLAGWVHSLLEHAGQERKKKTREDEWANDWKFINGTQWEGPMPTYRRPIVVNAWRRVLHVVLAVLLGQRPLLKLVPQGPADPHDLDTWQAALWALMKTEDIVRKIGAEALPWGLAGDGGWIKIGYGTRSLIPGDLPDVLVSAPHPAKVYPDPECTDVTLAECPYILFRDSLDLSTISRRYPAQAHRVKPDAAVSMSWRGETPEWAQGNITIAPAGGWSVSGEYRRARAGVVECWIDDGKPEYVERDEIVGVLGTNPLTGAAIPKIERVGSYRLKYPYGRVITATHDTVLRDIPNPFGPAFGHTLRWPFVFLPGAESPHMLWRPGLLADYAELQRAINKSLSLLIENAVKVTNALVIADESAMDDEDWDLLSLIPGAKFRKRQGTELKVIFPQPLPAQAFQLPDYLIRKLEEQTGLHDPPIAPGQAVAAKTVQFLQAKGSAILGVMAKAFDEALERVGNRVVALQLDRYLTGRLIPYFTSSQDGMRISEFRRLPELPAGMRLRVEAGSAYTELVAAMAEAAQAEAQAKKLGGRRR